MILSLVLLVALLPVAAIEASAASNATSNSAITILKKLETFKSKCDLNYRIGYGTKCTETGVHGTGTTHEIRENEADVALRAAMKDIDKAINNFATSRGLNLTQGQHDALAVFSFENGTAWMQGTDDLQNAVVTGVTGTAFVKVMTDWKAGTADDGRRKVEANMYLNGKYDTNPNALVIVDNSSSDDPDDLVNDTRVKVTVTNAYINVREKASIFSTKVGTVYQGEVLRITTTKSADGYLWGRYVNEKYEKVGYVALMYTNYDQLVTGYENSGASNVTAPTAIDYAKVTANGYVNVRSGAGTKNPIVSSLRNTNGEYNVPVYEIQYVNGQKWARTNAGWFSLAYGGLKNGAAGYTNDYNYQNYKFTSGGAAVTVGSTETAIDKATFTTKMEVTTRETASIGGVRKDTLASGTEFDVTKVLADNNTIWGWTVDTQGKYEGWVDLSTEYVTRKGATITTEPDPSTVKCTVATVINCAEVNIRNMADIGGSKVGTLPAGTTVQVKEGPKNGTRKTGWYRLAVANAHGTESWVRGDYLDVREGTKAEINYGVSNNTITSPDGTKAATGRGMVANTYGGVNVRTNPGTVNAKVTKLLPGTTVDILEVTYYGTTKWGRIEQGWVCMDYIAMMDYDDLGSTGGSSTNVSSTTAIYEGKAKIDGVKVYQSTDRQSDVVRTLSVDEAVNVLELLTVTSVFSDDGITTVSHKIHWARVNDGYICDNSALYENEMKLSNVLSLNPLYEETYTVTGTDLLKVREAAGTSNAREDLDLKKGDQVKITSLEIVEDQVWGKFEHDDLTGGEGWICLSYCTKGAVSIGSGDAGNAGSGEGGGTEGGNGGNAVTGETLSIGNTGKGNYMGTIIGKYNEVNVRKDPDANAEKVTELKKGATVTITETTLVDGRSWGYCGTGWINLVYVDLTPVGITAIDAKVIATHNTLCYASSETGADIVGSYASRAVVNIYEEVNGMYRTDMGWVSKDNFL